MSKMKMSKIGTVVYSLLMFTGVLLFAFAALAVLGPTPVQADCSQFLDCEGCDETFLGTTCFSDPACGNNCFTEAYRCVGDSFCPGGIQKDQSCGCIL